MATVVKRKGHTEPYDERKAYASCYSACLNAHYDTVKAEKCAEDVIKDLTAWVLGRSDISSKDIFKFLTEKLTLKDKEVGFMYETHKDIV